MTLPNLRFSGFSDDTFGEYSRTKQDYDNCAAAEPIDWKVVDPSGDGVLVSGRYGQHNCCWSITVLPYGRGVDEPNLPPWPIRFESPNETEEVYSPVLVIEAPEDVSVTCLQAKAKKE